jgi:ABC-type transport system involved in Fe-S cluster assembly fused permease/ATPase subunit
VSEGQILEKGSHQALLSINNGMYKALVERQCENNQL